MAARILPFGDAAILVELEPHASIDGARRARALASAITAAPTIPDGLGTPIPAAASVLVPFDPAAIYAEQVEELLRHVLAGGVPEAPPPTDPTLHRIPVRYGGDDGPDLEPVAADLGMTVSDVVDLHTGVEVEVLFLGFAPGFAYLGELSPRLRVPRLATPRVRVPAGSVAIAGAMSAVYPHESAGGWRILGRADVELFDPAADPPNLLRPGDRVRFEPA